MCLSILRRGHQWLRNRFPSYRVGRARPVLTRRQKERAKLRSPPRQPRRIRIEQNASGDLVHDVGPRTLDRFEQLYRDCKNISSIQTQVDERKRQILNCQRQIDFLKCQLLYLEKETRIDGSEEIQSLETSLSEWTDEKREAMDALAAHEAQAAVVKRSQDDGWRQFYSIAFQYFDCCLAADFEANWSVDHHGCCQLRTIADEANLISDTQEELQDLVLRRSRVRNGIFNSERLLKDSSMNEVLRGLENARKEKFEDEMRQLESEMRTLEGLQKLRRTNIDERKDNFCWTVARPLLEANGRIDLESSNAKENSQSQDVEPARDLRNSSPTDDRRRNRDNIITVASDGERDGLERPPLSPEQLQENYVELCDEVEDLRRHYQGNERELREAESEHLSTFRTSSRRRYEALISKQMGPQAEHLRLREADLLSIYQQLIRAGIPAPRSPGSRSPRRGAVTNSTRKSGSAGSEGSAMSETASRRKRLGVNSFRLSTAGAASIDPPSPEKSLADSDGLPSTRRKSESPSPDAEREQRLRKRREDHEKHQEELRKQRERGSA